MPTSPTSGPGGGGSGLPSQWSADSHGNVVAETDQAAGMALAVQGIPLQSGSLFEVVSDSGTRGLDIAGDGVDDISGITMQTADGGTVFAASPGGDTSLAGDPLLTLSGGTQILFSTSESVWGGTTAAPPDAHLAVGQFALWLDATPGVGNTKLMVKAKDSAGTVRSAAVVLA